MSNDLIEKNFETSLRSEKQFNELSLEEKEKVQDLNGREVNFHGINYVLTKNFTDGCKFVVVDSIEVGETNSRKTKLWVKFRTTQRNKVCTYDFASSNNGAVKPKIGGLMFSEENVFALEKCSDKKFDTYVMDASHDYSFCVVIVGNADSYKLDTYDKYKDRLTNENPEGGTIKFLGCSGIYKGFEGRKPTNALVQRFKDYIETVEREDIIDTYSVWIEDLIRRDYYYVWHDGVTFRATNSSEIYLGREAGQARFYNRDRVESEKILSELSLSTPSKIQSDINEMIYDAKKLEDAAKELRETTQTHSGGCSRCSPPQSTTHLQEALINEKKAKKLRENARNLEKFAEDNF